MLDLRVQAIGGNYTGVSITLNSSTGDIAGQMTGGSVTLNGSTLFVGQNVTGGSITYGTDAVAITAIHPTTPTARGYSP
jgi:hypothetical protein